MILIYFDTGEERMNDFYDKQGTDLRDQFQQEYVSQQAAMEHKRKSRSMIWIGVAAALVLLMLIIGGTAVGTYNSLTTKHEKIAQDRSDIETLLQRRADLIPNLVNTVKGYAAHEDKIFGEIAEARARLVGAGTLDEKLAANQQLSNAIRGLTVVVENYPNLKANEQFLELQKQLEGTENRISVARQDYNETVTVYNTSRQQFPTVIMANLFGFQREEPFKAQPGSEKASDVDFK